MKLNWGHYLAIAMTLFIGFILYLIIFIRGGKDDLTDVDYYEKGMQHDSQMGLERNAMPFREAVKISYTSGIIYIQLPDSQRVQKLQLDLLKPNDASKDLHLRMPLVVPNDSTQQCQARFRQLLEKGIWMARIHWEVDSVGFFVEKDLFVES
jgi:hypothetical protein